MADLIVTIEDIELEADWLDDNPETRAAIAEALPVEADAARWGDELYFEIPVDVPEEHGQVEVPVGAIAYWPQGNALCVFWGLTPASVDDTPRAASAVNIVARLRNASAIDVEPGGAHVRVERA
jgi:hypothetical protein